MNWVCDHEPDCSDGSDEKRCSHSCRQDQFKCLSGDCIPKVWKCDGTPDCNDGSDEPSDCEVQACHQDLEFKCNNTGKTFLAFSPC